MSNRKFIKYLFEVSILLLTCWGAYAWFTWQWVSLNTIDLLLVYISFSFIAFIYKRTYNVRITLNTTTILALLFLLLGSMFPIFGVTTFLNIIFKYYPLLVLLNDREHFHEHIRLFNNLLAYILVVGILFYVLFFVGFIFPGIPSQLGDLEINKTYSFHNYIFMLRSIFEAADTVRFQSVFLEPGYLGSLMAFMLYANKYDFSNWNNKIYLVSLIISFSLAGYIVTIIGYILYKRSQGRAIKSILSYITLLITLYFGAQFYNGGNNKVNELIIQRLQFDSEKGISGNNRFTESTKDNFEFYLTRGELWFGQAKILDEHDVVGAGYMRFFLMNGIISAIFYLLFYIIMVRYSKNKKYAYGFVIMVILTFIQAAYPASYSWIIPYVFSLNNDRLLTT